MCFCRYSGDVLKCAPRIPSWKLHVNKQTRAGCSYSWKQQAKCTVCATRQSSSASHSDIEITEEVARSDRETHNLQTHTSRKKMIIDRMSRQHMPTPTAQTNPLFMRPIVCLTSFELWSKLLKRGLYRGYIEDYYRVGDTRSLDYSSF